MITTIVLTFNEEKNIENCVTSVRHLGPIIVIDSYSSDRTPSIARGLGCKVISREFLNYSDQRNFGLNLKDICTSWILMIDADEVLDQTALDVLGEIEKIHPSIDGLSFQRVDMLLGKRLRFCGENKLFFPRVFRKGKVRVEREINEVYEGNISESKGVIIHTPFNNGIDSWLAKHRRYAKMETTVLTSSNDNLVNSSETSFRLKLKKIFFKLYFFPEVYFLYIYFFRLGFLDGVQGLLFARMKYIYFKEIQIRRLWKTLS